MKNIFLIYILTSVQLMAYPPLEAFEKEDQIIKSITHYKVNVNTGKKVLYQKSSFDKQGNIISQIYYKDEKETSKVVFEYSDEGYLLSVNDIENGKKTPRVVYSYNDKGIKVQEVTAYEKVVFQYDDKGDLILKSIYDIETNEVEHFIKKYFYQNDQLDKIITVRQEGNENEPEMYRAEQFIYNAKGQLEEEKYVTRFDERTFTYEYTNGQLDKKIELAFGGTEKIIRRFNETGKKVEEQIFRRKTLNDEFQLSQMNTWAFNDFGDLIERKSTRNGIVINNELLNVEYYD